MDFEPLEDHHYCLLVTFRRSGEPIPTPVLFGLQDGKLYLRTDASTAKVTRIRNDPRVLVGPANSRGKPRGPLARGTARLMFYRRERRRLRGAEAELHACAATRRTHARRATDRDGVHRGRAFLSRRNAGAYPLARS
jgi:PPOX class probable F420-dependent enzyme